MRSGRLTVVLLAIAVVLVVAVPTLRSLVATRLRPAAGLDSRGFPLASTYATIVAAHPQDAELWQAYAEALWSRLEYAEGPAQEPVREETIHEAYEKAVELEPNSAAARFSHAVFQLGRMKLRTLPDEGVSEGEPSGALTGPQIERLQTARGLLAECARLAPENAAVDYLLAWTYLAEQRNDEAFAALEGARAKSGWSTYQGESARASLALVDKTKVETMYKPMVASRLSVTKGFAFGTTMRSLARTLRNLGDQFREAGDHEQAVACYEAVAHVGHLMRVNAHHLVDGLTAVALSAIAVSSEAWAPEDEEARLHADKDLRKSELRAPGFAAYLREHERDDLAAFVLSDLEAAMRWREDSHAVVKRLGSELVWDISGGGVLNAAAVGAAGATLLGVAVLVGLLSLRARYWREPQRQAPWSYRQWLILLLVLLLPGQIAAAAFTRVLWLRQEITSPVWGSVLIAGVALGVVAWLVGVLMIALRRRRALAEPQRFGKARSFLRGLRALVCPTLAALILVSVLGAWLVEGRMNRASARHRQIALQGEARYWGIGSGGAEARVARSRPKIRLFSVVEAATKEQPRHVLTRTCDSAGKLLYRTEIWLAPNGDRYEEEEYPIPGMRVNRWSRKGWNMAWQHEVGTSEYLLSWSRTYEDQARQQVAALDLPTVPTRDDLWLMVGFVVGHGRHEVVEQSDKVGQFKGQKVRIVEIKTKPSSGTLAAHPCPQLVRSWLFRYYLTADSARVVRLLATICDEKGDAWQTHEVWPIDYDAQPPAELFEVDFPKGATVLFEGKEMDPVWEHMDEAEREKIVETVNALAEAWRSGDFGEFEKHYDFAAGLEYGVKGKFTAEWIRERWKWDVERQPERWADQELIVDYGFGTAEPPAMALSNWSIYREKPQSGDGWILYRQEPSKEPGITVLARVKVTDHDGESKELGTRLFLKKIGGGYKVILWRPPFG